MTTNMPTYTPPPSPPGSYAPPVSADGQWLYNGGQWWPNSTVSVASTAGTGSTNTGTATGITNNAYGPTMNMGIAGESVMTNTDFAGHMGMDQWGRGSGSGFDPNSPPTLTPGYEWVTSSNGGNYDLKDTRSGQIYSFDNIPQDVYKTATGITAGTNTNTTGSTDTTLTGGAGGAETGTGTGTGTGAGTLDPSQSTLSANFAPYIYDMLLKGQTAADLPFQAFTGQRFAYGVKDPITGQYSAGYAPLEREYFNTVSGLQAPSMTEATNLAKTATQGLGAYASGTFDNQFTAPEAYSPTIFNTGLGAVGAVQDYMNPYLSGVSDIEAREARREADISRQAEQARLAQAGAYGGSRQAIMEAERQRNLGTQIGDIRAKGLQAAFDRAIKQRLEEAELGLTAQRDTEASRRFGATQGMTAAQERARYGMDALKAREESRQFGARYGLDAAARELDAARTLGDIEAAQFGLGLKAAQEQAAAGKEQRAIAQSPLDFGYQQWLESVRRPAEQAKEMQGLLAGLPLQAPAYQPEQSAIAAALQGLIGALGFSELID